MKKNNSNVTVNSRINPASNGIKKSLISLIFVVGMVVIVLFPRLQQAKVLHAVLGGEALLLEIADTDALLMQGLSGHPPLAPGEGMLFVFPSDGHHSFWMKDMLFSIDIIWLDSEYRIVDVKERVSPESYPEVFAPKALSRYVVELPSGFFLSHHLKIGNVLEFSK